MIRLRYYNKAAQQWGPFFDLSDQTVSIEITSDAPYSNSVYVFEYKKQRILNEGKTNLGANVFNGSHNKLSCYPDIAPFNGDDAEGMEEDE